jgi:hypothetical protein
MPLPDGWRRIRKGEEGYSSTARTYFDPEGRIRSRRAADNERLRESGWGSKRDFDRRYYARKDRGYNRWQGIASEADVPESEIRQSDSEFNRLFLDARADNFAPNPDGAFALFLTYIGLRDPDWTWDVGDTPLTA